MILEALKGLAALPRLVDAVESLSDIARVQLAESRKTEKDEEVDLLIDAARARRQQRLLDGEAARLLRDSSEEPAGDGGRDSNG